MDIITKTVKQPLGNFFIELISNQDIFLIILIILCLISTTLYFILKHKTKKFNKETSYVEKNELKNKKEKLLELQDAIHTIIYITIGVTIINLANIGVNTYNYYRNGKKAEIKASIIEIKDNIKIKDNKLTIKELPKDYKYVKGYLDKNEPHDFKIVKDDFYQDSEIKLIDVAEREYKVSGKEFKELESQKK